MHKLLNKQIAKYLPDDLRNHGGIDKLFEAISQSYNAFERDRELSERAFKISEDEYVEINQKLVQEIELKKKAIVKIKRAISTIVDVPIKNESDDLLIISRYLEFQLHKRKNAELVIGNLLANMQQGILLTDSSGIIQFSNSKIVRLLGIDFEEIIKPGGLMNDFMHSLLSIINDGGSYKSKLENVLKYRVQEKNIIIELRNNKTLQLDYIPLYKNLEEFSGHLITFGDITEISKSQKLNEKNAAANKLILNTALDAVIVINEMSEITFWNPKAEAMFGWKSDEVIGKNMAEVIVPFVYRRPHAVGMNNLKETGSGPALNRIREEIAINKDGKEFPVELSMVEVTQGNEKSYCGFLRDISERKRIEEDLKRLSLVASANTNGVLFTTVDGNIVWSNEGYLRMTGFQAADVLGKSPILISQGPLSSLEAIAEIRTAFYGGKSFDVEVVYYRKDGSYFWGRAKGQPIKDKQGNIVQFFTMIEDITQSKMHQEEMQVLSSIAAQNTNAVTICDAEGKIEWVNKSFEVMTGYHLADIKGYKPGDFLQGKETDSKTIKYLRKKIKVGEPFNCDILNYHKSGNPYWVRIQGQALRNQKGEIIKYFAIEQDITQEKESIEKIREAEQLWQFALEGAGDGVWEYDLEKQKAFYSRQYKRMLGYEEYEFKNDSAEWYSRIHPDDLASIEHTDQQYADGKVNSHQREYRMRHKNGQYIWILDRGMVIKYKSDGTPKTLVGTHTNISHIKKTEDELSNRVKQFQSLAENIQGVIFEYELKRDGSVGYRYISPKLEEIFGIQVEEFTSFADYIHPDDKMKFTEKFKRCSETLEPFNDESRLVHPYRGIIWRSITASLSYIDPDGTIIYTGFILDITERKNIEQALRTREEKYRSIIANMHLGLLEVDNEEKIQFANHSFCEMCGFSLEELIGSKASDLFLRAGDIEMMEQKNEMRKIGHSDAYEICVKTKTGETKWWLISGAPRFNDKSELVGSIGIHLDITTQKKQELDLLEAREQAETSASAKQTFLANMSHEIRTPMNAILGMSRQLQKTELDEKQHLYLQTINEAGENLLVIINDILDISKIESGKLNLEKIGFHLRDVIARSIQVMKHRAEEKGLRFSSSFDDRIGSVLLGDPYRLNQVLLNLMSNAIKFSEKGMIYVSCQLVKELEGKQVVEINVADTGIGMSKEFIDNLFKSFSQEDRSVSRKYGGTGLGMSITKQLVELMGGAITVESEKNIGSSFKITIPFEQGDINDLEINEINLTDSRVLKNKRILLVEDNEMNRLVATASIGHYGAIITEVVNGLEAVNAVKSFNYDLILMDMQMPVMDGLEATRIIREQLKSTVPIIALTANAIKGENEKCLAAGMNAYISKPFQEEELVNLMASWLGAKEITFEKNKEVVSDELYNLSKLKEISRGNDAFVQKMVSLFIEQVPISLEEIHTAFQHNQFATIKAVAHRIKPSIDNMGIGTLTVAIRKIETLALENKHSKELTLLIQKMDHILNKVIEELKTELKN